jgi:hypothetical protein
MCAVVASAALCSCGRGTVSSQAELFEWMRDHGLVDTVVTGGLFVECALRTKNLSRAEHLSDGERVPFQVTLTIAPQKSSSGGDVIFNGVTSVDDFSVRLRDLALRFHEQVTLTQGSRQLKCIGAEMDYDIGLTRRKRLLLTFPLTMKEASGSDVAIHIANMIIQPFAADFELSTSNVSSLPTVQP